MEMHLEAENPVSAVDVVDIELTPEFGARNLKIVTSSGKRMQ